MKKKLLSLLLVCIFLLSCGTVFTMAAGQDVYTGFSAGSVDDYKCERSSFKTGKFLAGIWPGDWACYKALDFGKDGAAAVELNIGVAPGNAEYVELRIDAPDGPLIASVPIIAGEWSIPVPCKANLLITVKGVHDVYLTHAQKTSDIYNIKFFPASGKNSIMPEYTENDAYVDIEEDANRRTINLLHQMGLLRDNEDKIFDPQMPITRGEFVYSVYKLYGVEESETPVSLNFTDVDSSEFYAQAVAFLTERGIIKGITETTFEPDAFLRHVDAIAVLSRILEYDDLVAYHGGYPQGYLRVAHDKELFVNGVGNTDYLRRTDMTALLYNAILADGFSATEIYDEAVKYNTVGGILYKTQKIERARGKVVSNFVTNLFLPETDVTAEEVVIGETVYKVGNTNASSLLGFDCEYFYREVDGEKTLVAIMPLAKVRTYTISSAKEMIETITDSEIVYYDSEEHREVFEMEQEYAVLYNGVAVDDSLENLVGTVGEFCGEIRFIENADGVHVIMIDEFVDYVIKSINSKEEIIQDALTGVKVPIGGDDINSFYKTADGQTAYLFDMAEGHVLTVYSSKNKTGKQSLRGFLSTQELSGTVTEIENETVYIDGIPYEVSPYCKETIKVSDKGRFKISKNNMIVAYQYADVEQRAIGLYFNYNIKRNGLSQSAEIKLFTENESTTIYPFAERVNVDGIRIKDVDTLENGTTAWRGLANLEGETPVLYSLNADKEIVALDTVLTGTAGANDMLKQLSNGTEKFRRIGGVMITSGVGTCYLPKNAKVISLFSNSTDEDNISFTNVQTAFARGTQHQGEVYSTVGDSYSGDLFVWRNSDANVKHSELFVFEEMTKGLSEDGEVVRYVNGKMGSGAKKYILPEASYQSGALSQVFQNIRPGDVLRVRVDAVNQIFEAEVAILVDAQAERGSITPVLSESIRKSGDEIRDVLMVYGSVAEKGENYVAIDIGSGIELLERSNAEVITIRKRESDGKYLVTTGQTVQNLSVGDVIMAYVQYGTTKQIVVYKDHIL